ncbi:MAG: Mechanosensitive channel MscK [Candidatus Ordinivivax streblomastigis]|uniref:Mechanosensitive channel MscK n=1 Tax=Candidatus Ordinivivax streblomastigis TaxID=2540710 RepID=A0A5M8NYC7_9BACT|nr:MAG: Mechanosensitive channel MscK [Candidatus Ordinivivax streblomastigis]
MKQQNRICFLCLVWLFASMQPAVSQSSLSHFLDDLSDSIQTVNEPSDTSKLQTIQHQLADSRLNEQNLRMEVEQMKLLVYTADSVKLLHQKQLVDSLRIITQGIPVVVETDTLFYLYTNRGGLSPTKRALQISHMIINLGKEYNMQPDSVYIISEDITTDIMYNDKVIISLTDKDGLWANSSRDELATHYRTIIVDTLRLLKEKHSFMALVKHILLLSLVLVVLFILIRLVNFGYHRLKKKLHDMKGKYFKPLYLKKYEFLSVDRQLRIFYFLANTLRYAVIILLFIITLPIIFSIFPQTENLALQIFSYILSPAKKIAWSIIHYIPNLFVIALIWLVIHYITRGLGSLAREIGSGHLRIRGFYPDWAGPTHSIIRFLLYAFMISLIYPYLPNAQSGIFQGISVFIGLIVSFGSSSAIGNLIAGIVLTYMRPFKIGDKIKYNDLVGNVVEKTPIVTRIRTIKNEIVTVPNGSLMNAQTVNYSESVRQCGLLIHLEVSCGYETPWRQIHQLLIEAAKNTPGIVPESLPFVHETAFNDFYVNYEINAPITDANQMSAIYSDLRANIQDKFKEAGVNILSPHYYIRKGDK